MLPIVLTASLYGSATLKNPNWDEISRNIDRMRISQHVPGVSVAIFQGKGIVFAKGFGNAILDPLTPVTTDTRFWIGSITKQFTSALVMHLVEKHKLSLDEKLSEVYTKSPANWGDITVRQLLNQESGLPEYFQVIFDYNHPMNIDKVFSSLSKLPVVFEPGDRYEYCNTNYLLLGKIIEQASGMSYYDYLNKLVVNPYHLNSIGIMKTSTEDSKVAQGYAEDDGSVLMKSDTIDSSIPYAAGAIQATPSDLVKWINDLDNGFLSKGSLNELYTPGTPKTGISSYGFGWVISKFNGHPSIGHDGQIPGFSSSVIRVILRKKEEYTVAVFANLTKGDPAAIGTSILQELIPFTEPSAIEDNDPKTTIRIKNFMKSAIRDEIDYDFASKNLGDLLKTKFKDGSLGLTATDIDKMRLIESGGIPETRVYFIQLQGQPFRISFNLSQDDKLVGVVIAPY